MRLLGYVLATVLMFCGTAFARDSSFEQMLRRLDPETRLDQLCGSEAMRRIDKDKNRYHPDRADVGALSEPTAKDNVMRGSGGAFRSGGHWYRFSFTCRTSPDRLKVLEFKYAIGGRIPETEWETYGLWK